jgi:histidinol-phosphate aminotransferase
MAFAGDPVINYMNKVKYPYNISTASQQLALDALENINAVNDWIQITVEQRKRLSQQLAALPFTITVYPSDANFILVKMKDARKIYEYLSAKGIIVRDRSKVILCDDCLRITIGTPEENQQLVTALNAYQ